ncbi:hypothetical protein [Stenotrophomonas maltophilia]|jgi:hypothetical protein|uniref:hypothetical protein n=1 Tax=Stenotrophomonas maltophilia TaxID=40324 RepID=UPI000C159E81|nr:hypothetical protein [Stenotrophomonas maltophilia]HEL4238608.1 hypothetical protein [Stenotrophomonas maltophilia]
MSEHPGKTDAQAWHGLAIRPLHPADLDLICAHREAMFRESGRPADVLEQMADDAFAERKVSYTILHATAQATPLYAGLGWVATSEMARALHGNGNCP